MQEVIQFFSHHVILATTLLIIFSLLLVVEWIRATQRSTAITPLHATQLINHQQAVVVDIRSTLLYDKGHIIHALAMDPATIVNGKKLAKFRARPIILVCQEGLESTKLATTLAKQTYQVYALAGGMSKWLANHLPIHR